MSAINRRSLIVIGATNRRRARVMKIKRETEETSRGSPNITVGVHLHLTANGHEPVFAHEFHCISM